jgi:hypothetical protein
MRHDVVWESRGTRGAESSRAREESGKVPERSAVHGAGNCACARYAVQVSRRVKKGLFFAMGEKGL